LALIDGSILVDSVADPCQTGTVIGPEVAYALKFVTALKAYFDAKQLRDQLDAIEWTVGALAGRIEDVLMVDVKTAFLHLETASKASSDELRRAELMLARASFARMTERPTESLSRPAQQELKAEHVAAIGHAGNYSYFLLNSEPRLALSEAYLCTERFPALGVQLFPVEIFSRDYRNAGRSMIERRVNRDEIRSSHQSALTAHAANRSEYVREMAWRVPLAGAAFVGFLAAGVVSPGLAAQAPMRAAGILAGTGNRAMTDVPGFKPRLDLGAAATDPPEEVELMRQASAESLRRRHALNDVGH
jgi:hypothetical protein